MFRLCLKIIVVLLSTGFSLSAATVHAQSFVLDFKQPLFSVCNLRESCTIAGIQISAFRTANGEQFIQDAETTPALLHWDTIDGIGVIGGKEDDEIDPDEMVVVELPAYRAIKMFSLSDLFLGSQGRDSDGGEYATIYTHSENGRINRYDLQGGIDLPKTEFNTWASASDLALSNQDGDGEASASLAQFQPETDSSLRLYNGEKEHFMESSLDNRVNRIEFLALQKENNDYSIEAIEFWRTSAARFSRSGGS